jgi:hypothetical protein
MSTRSTVNRRRVVFAMGLLAMGGVLGLGFRRFVWADGIPDMNPLYYSGTLTEGGQAVTGTRAITVNVWPDGSASTMPLCQTVSSTTNVVGGRFRIALASSCKAALNQNNNAWVEVVDGATSVGRAKIGAVPYAVEADHAVAATSAASAATAASLAAGPIAGQLTVYTVPGAKLATPCAVVGMTSYVTDCTCPAGTFALSGGGDAGQGSGHFLRESRALTTTTWRVSCATAAGADAPCATYNLVCSRVGP